MDTAPELNSRLEGKALGLGSEDRQQLLDTRGQESYLSKPWCSKPGGWAPSVMAKAYKEEVSWGRHGIVWAKD